MQYFYLFFVDDGVHITDKPKYLKKKTTKCRLIKWKFFLDINIVLCDMLFKII